MAEDANILKDKDAVLKYFDEVLKENGDYTSLAGDDKRKAALEKVTKFLEGAIGKYYSGDTKEIPLTKEVVKDLVNDTFAYQQKDDKWNGKYNLSMTGRGSGYEYSLDERIAIDANKLFQTEGRKVTAESVSIAAKARISSPRQDLVDYADEKAGKLVAKSIKDELANNIKDNKAIKTFNKKIEELSAHVTDDYVAKADEFAAELTKIATARAKYSADVEAWEKDKKGDKPKADDLEKAEKGLAESLQKYLTDTADFKDGDKKAEKKEAFLMLAQDRFHQAYEAMDEKAQKAARESKVGSDISGMMTTSLLKKYAGIGKSGMSAGGSFTENVKSNWGKAAAGAGVAAAGIYAAMKGGGEEPVLDDKGQETGETQKKGMSFWGKVAVTVGVIGGLALMTSAARGGNFVEGWKQADKWTDKISQSVKTGFRIGH
jgi:hypothetical protein